MWKKLFFVMICIGLTLLAVEAALRISGKFKTYTERTGGYYYSYYNKTYPTWYLTYPPDSLIVKKQAEFTNSYRTNSLGLREREIPIAKTDSMKRIFVLGDSFVEGDGVDYEHSMPWYLEKELNGKGIKCEVYDCGVAGSDPIYNYVLLRDKLMKYHPTHVIMCFNNSDVDDIILRGGMERFQKDGTTVTRNGPWWQGLYAWSHTVRMVATAKGYGETFISKKEERALQDTAVNRIYDCLQMTRQLCAEQGIYYISVLQPYPDAFVGDGSAPINQIHTNRERPPIHLESLLPVFAPYLKNDGWKQYTWPINKHFNEKGYELYANLLVQTIDLTDKLDSSIGSLAVPEMKPFLFHK